MHGFPNGDIGGQANFKRQVVSSFKVFCFLVKPFNETFWNVIFVFHLKMKIFMNTF